MTYTSEETFSEETFFHTICNNISADHLKYRLQGIISPITFLNCRNIQFSSLKTVLRFLMPFYENKRETIKKSNKSNTTHTSFIYCQQSITSSGLSQMKQIFFLYYLRLTKLPSLHLPSRIHFHTKEKKIITCFSDSSNSNNITRKMVNVSLIL